MSANDVAVGSLSGADIIIQDKLANLGCLATPGVAPDQYNGTVVDGGHDLILHGEDRQLAPALKKLVKIQNPKKSDHRYLPAFVTGLQLVVGLVALAPVRVQVLADLIHVGRGQGTLVNVAPEPRVPVGLRGRPGDDAGLYRPCFRDEAVEILAVIGDQVQVVAALSSMIGSIDRRDLDGFECVADLILKFRSECHIVRRQLLDILVFLERSGEGLDHSKMEELPDERKCAALGSRLFVRSGLPKNKKRIKKVREISREFNYLAETFRRSLFT